MDRRRIVLAFLYTFKTAGAYVIARATTDALFLSRAGVEWLPLVFFISAILLGAVSGFFARFGVNAPLRRVILLTLFVLATSTIGLCSLVEHYGESIWLFAAIYLLAELRGCLNSIQYGIMLNELFAASPSFHEANGRIGAAATFAGIGFGAFVGVQANSFGVIEMLYLAAGLELLAMIPVLLLRRTRSSERSTQENSFKDESRQLRGLKTGLRIAARSRRVRHIAYLVAFGVVVATLVEFQWKTSVADHFHSNENGIAGFLGWIHAGIGLVCALVQLCLTGPLLRRFRNTQLLSILPLSLFITSACVLIATTKIVLFVAFVGVKSCDVFKRSVNIPVILSLYAEFPSGMRRRAITLVTGIVKPLSEAFGASLILLLVSMGKPSALIYLTLILICGWLHVATRGKPRAPKPRPAVRDSPLNGLLKQSADRP